MILSKELKMEALSQIIDREFGVVLHKFTKKQEYVDARKVFCKILNETGFNPHEVCDFMRRSLTIHNYYLKDVDSLLKYNPETNEKYLKCKELFFITVRGVNQDEPEYVVGARSKVNYSVWDKESLNKVEDKYERIKNIIQLIDFNTPVGKENFVFEKLVHVFEKLSDDGKENRQRKR